MIQTQVSTKYQVVIPKEVRKKIKIQPGQKMNINVSGEQIILSPAPKVQKWNWPDDYLKKLKNPWEGKDSTKYLEEERNSWD